MLANQINVDIQIRSDDQIFNDDNDDKSDFFKQNTQCI